MEEVSTVRAGESEYRMGHMKWQENLTLKVRLKEYQKIYFRE
jgi:hypothetical protein